MHTRVPAVFSLALLAGSALPAWADGDSTKARVAMIEIEGAPTERPNELAWLFGPGKEHTLHDYLTAIDRVADDDNYAGLVLRLKDAELGASQVEELGAAITEVRRADKKVHLFADAYGTTELMLGSYADEVIAQDGAPVSLPGMYMEEMFLADTLAWAGIHADMVQVGDYKGASEQMARNGPSKEWDQNINALLDSMYANVRSPLMAGRKISGEQLDKAMTTAWMTDAKEAKGYTFHYPATVKGAEIHGQFRKVGEAPSMTLTGTIGADGNAAMNVKGLAGNPKYNLNNVNAGSPVNFDVVGKFEGRKGTGNRTSGRPCRFTFTKK